MLRRVTAQHQRWPLSRPFRIARGEKTAADVVVVEIEAGGVRATGEAVPYLRYGESVESVLAQVDAVAPALADGLDREALQRALPAGAARNAVDCALWDLEAKLSGRSVAEMLGQAPLQSLETAVTVSLDTPEKMAGAAALIADAPLLKIKVDGGDPVTAVRAVRSVAKDARLIVDPNESWSPQQLIEFLPAMAALDVALLEQPVPADADAALEGLRPAVPLCADEAAHTRADLERVAKRYQAVNIKLDKAGGLTEGLMMLEAARAMGMQLMVGCMISTSLGVAPALHLARHARFVDLDGPWWLAEDRPERMRFAAGRMSPPERGWGAPTPHA